ncbi:MAG: hypothetical protein ACHQU8_03830 [Gemmatimonadales bacterium]
MPELNRFALPEGKRVGPRWIAASIAAHGALVLGLLGAYRGFVMQAGNTREVVAVDLRVPKVRRLPPPPAQSAAPPRSSTPIMSLPQMSSAIPTRILPEAPHGGDTNGVRGGIGMSPVRGDPRLWVQPMYLPEGGGRPINMDSVVRQRMMVMADMMDSAVRNDSLSPTRNPLATPRWTFEHDGKTYGIDQSGIHFGSFSIPTAVLAFLPFPQGNIDQARAYNRMLDMRSDILRAAARAEAEDDFRRAVAEIRERKDRERREQRARDAQQRRDNDQPIP